MFFRLSYQKLSIVSLLALFFIVHVSIAVEKDLVGYWSFDENSDMAKDVSGNGNDGKIIGLQKRVTGIKGQALEFDKTKKTYVEVVDDDALDITDAITIEAWINPKSVYIGDDWKQQNCVLGKVRAYYLTINEQGHLASYLYNVQPQEWLVGKTDMQQFISEWVHVAMVYDGKDHALYINGEKDADVSKKGQIQTVSENLEIGWVDNERYFDGLIDEVKLWARALSKEELESAASSAVTEPTDKLPIIWGKIKKRQKMTTN